MNLEELEKQFIEIAQSYGVLGWEFSPEGQNRVIGLLTEENISLLDDKSTNLGLIDMALWACYLLDNKDKFQKICELRNVRNRPINIYALRYLTGMRHEIIENNKTDFLKALMKLDLQKPGSYCFASQLTLALTSNAKEVFNVLIEDKVFQQHLEIYQYNLHAPVLRVAAKMGNIDALKRLLESNAVLDDALFIGGIPGLNECGLDPSQYSMKTEIEEVIETAKINAYHKIVRFSESTEHATMSECEIANHIFNALGRDWSPLIEGENISIEACTELGNKLANKLLENRIRVLCEKFEKSDNIVFSRDEYISHRDFDDILSGNILYRNDIESIFLPEIMYPGALSATLINESRLKFYSAVFNYQAHSLYDEINGVDINNINYVTCPFQDFKKGISTLISDMLGNEPTPYLSKSSKNDGKILVYAAFFSKQLSFIKLPGQEDVSGKLKQLKSDVDKLFSETPAGESSYLLRSVREQVAEECRLQRSKSAVARHTIS
ncbi:MAG: hypothetical protein ACHQAX_07820 [Gammaproteobacteria bacterium]